MLRGPLPEAIPNRRRSPRTVANGLWLAYSNGAQGVVRPIRNVSFHGAFVETQDRWCVDTVLQTQLIAEPPPSTPIPDEVTPGVVTAENGIQAPFGGNPALQAKKASANLSISVTCKIVRLVPEGICVDFIHHSRKHLLAVEHFLTAAEGGARTGEAKPSEAASPRAAHESAFSAAAKDYLWRFSARPVPWRPALQIIQPLRALAIWQRVRNDRPQGAGNERPVAAQSPAFVPAAARSVETTSGPAVAALETPAEQSETIRSDVWTRIRGVPLKWARLIALVILALVIAWMWHRIASGPARAPIGLQLVSRGKQLEIHWNHDAAVIRNAAKGVMRISDGGVQEVIEFDATQLRDGAVAYSPTSNDITVRFEINGLDGTKSSESMRSVSIP